MDDRELQEKIIKYRNEVQSSSEFQAQLKYLNKITQHFSIAIQGIALYSQRARHIYDEQLCNRGFDDLLQSALSIYTMIVNGVHNPAKRELRYCLEMTVKYLVVDQVCSGQKILDKTKYLKENIPRSSVSISDILVLPFDKSSNQQLISEIKDLFAQLSSYTHPSKIQLDAQLASYERGEYIGFESTKAIADANKILFRAYDIILTLLLVSFGQTMSGDLFIEVFDHDNDWKFHSGKYISLYSKLFNYKDERKKPKVT